VKRDDLWDYKIAEDAGPSKPTEDNAQLSFSQINLILMRRLLQRFALSQMILIQNK